MLKGISPKLSPELLSILYRMGHGDEIVLADAHFPSETFGKRVVRADGIEVPELLSAILPLFELDQYVEAPLVMTSAVEGDSLDPNVELRYRRSIALTNSFNTKIDFIDRFAFYERAQNAFAIVLTGELAKYGNIILKKGVTPISTSNSMYCG
ncbi:L-fucose mutarotase [Persicobacter diffluens]|uniref:L-fucose mutarotase n=1 Tax=Persicobacter diffluens TaxID=981 RepID=A0AAN4W2B0_9BACT|nr:L-fucose mutarotase [Persicobacter diffluens]